MSPMFERVAILGVGLLGGSLALACKEQGVAQTVIGYGRRKERIQAAKRRGIVDEGSDDLAATVRNADMVVVCMPVESITARIRELAPGLKPGAILTDVGSVKGPMVREIETLIPNGIHYVGSHPIAGGERSGYEEARANLYHRALCIVTPTEKTTPIALEQVTQFWKRLGAEIVTLEPDEHDLIYGGVSHLPHIIAFALMNAIGGMRTQQHGNFFPFGGNGLLDYTRIASSDPGMWRDIFLANREIILQHLKTFQNCLESLVTGIQHNDGPKLLEAFMTANGYREELLRHKK